MKPTRRKKFDIFNSEEGTAIRDRLLLLEHDEHYTTLSGHTSDLDAYPDGKIPFVEAHMLYLSRHQYVNPDHYLSNLRLQLRVR